MFPQAKKKPGNLLTSSQEVLVKLAETDPQLLAQILLDKQGIDVKQPAGLAPIYAGHYPARGKARVEDSAGREMAQQEEASEENSDNGLVLQKMGNAVPTEQYQQQDERRYRAKQVNRSSDPDAAAKRLLRTVKK